jgi:hypothetical protein
MLVPLLICYSQIHLVGTDRDFVIPGKGGLPVTGSAAWGRRVEVSLKFFIIETSGSIRGSGGTTSRVTVSARGLRVTLGKLPEISDRETRAGKIRVERRSALGPGPRASTSAKR